MSVNTGQGPKSFFYLSFFGFPAARLADEENDVSEAEKITDRTDGKRREDHKNEDYRVVRGVKHYDSVIHGFPYQSGEFGADKKVAAPLHGEGAVFVSENETDDNQQCEKKIGDVGEKGDDKALKRFVVGSSSVDPDLFGRARLPHNGITEEKIEKDRNRAEDKGKNV